MDNHLASSFVGVGIHGKCFRFRWVIAVYLPKVSYDPKDNTSIDNVAAILSISSDILMNYLFSQLHAHNAISTDSQC